MLKPPPQGAVPAFRFEIPIRWGDMDAMGHVNNTVYFRYMEQARISWFEALQVRPNPEGSGFLIVNAQCDFIRQLKYPGVVRVDTYVGDIGRSSFDTWIEMSPVHDAGQVYARGGARIVWVNFPLGRSEPLPPDVLARVTTPIAAIHR